MIIWCDPELEVEQVELGAAEKLGTGGNNFLYARTVACPVVFSGRSKLCCSSGSTDGGDDWSVLAGGSPSAVLGGTASVQACFTISWSTVFSCLLNLKERNAIH
jgi:hypothetical protein